jgi:hypothetical protein
VRGAPGNRRPYRDRMTKTEIMAMFSRNKSAAELDVVLGLLHEKGQARKSSRPPQDGKGRPAEVWEAV